MAIGIGGAGCKIASKLDPEAILVNVSEAEMTQVTSGGQRLLANLNSGRGQFRGARKDPQIGRDAYLSVQRRLAELIRGNKVFSSTGGGTGAGITSCILEDLTKAEEIAVEDKTFFGLILPYAGMESNEFVKNSSEFLSGPLDEAINSGNTGNIVLFSNRCKFEEKIAEDEYNTMLVDSLNVLLSIPKKNEEMKLLECQIDEEDFTLFLAKPYINHFCYFSYNSKQPFGKQLESNYNRLLLEPETPIEAMFLLEVPKDVSPTIFYDIVQYFIDMDVTPVYSVVENPELIEPFITVSLLYSRKPKELVEDFNSTVEHHTKAMVEKTLKQHVQLEKLNINLNDEGKAVAKKGGTGEDVLSILKRIGKL
ncbi:MAG: hypothetical protein J6866_08610 [Victivallales bacterium]|jgi:hypothetical protein|nr:hypothetical protein [Victivallales bacterium]